VATTSNGVGALALQQASGFKSDRQQVCLLIVTATNYPSRVAILHSYI